MRTIEGKLLDARRLPDWASSRHAMASAFGFRAEHHLFHADPVRWLRMTEPQATTAFADFLNALDRDTRVKRIHALLRALGTGRGQPPVNPRVTAEAAVDGNRRIDLFLQWYDGEGHPRAGAVEAKFGHRVLPGTLPAYQEHVQENERVYRESKSQPERPLLVVVSPLLRKHDEKALEDNPDWRWMSWRSLLLGFDRALDSRYDDRDFRQFRRTLWDRAHA